MKKILLLIALFSGSLYSMKKFCSIKNVNNAFKNFKISPAFHKFFIRSFSDEKSKNKTLFSPETFNVIITESNNRQISTNIDTWQCVHKIENETKVPHRDQDFTTQDDINTLYAILFQKPLTQERLIKFVSEYGDYDNQLFMTLIFDLPIQSMEPNNQDCFKSVLSTYINVCRAKNKVPNNEITIRAYSIIEKVAHFRQKAWLLENLEDVIRGMLIPN